MVVTQSDACRLAVTARGLSVTFRLFQTVLDPDQVAATGRPACAAIQKFLDPLRAAGGRAPGFSVTIGGGGDAPQRFVDFRVIELTGEPAENREIRGAEHDDVDS